MGMIDRELVFWILAPLMMLDTLGRLAGIVSDQVGEWLRRTRIETARDPAKTRRHDLANALGNLAILWIMWGAL